MKPVVYIASPYTKGDPGINVHCQCRAFDRMMNDGIVWPVVPLWSHFQHTMFPRPYRDWIDYDLAMLERYDACFRIPATFVSELVKYVQYESSGADGEVKRFHEMRKPVFYGLNDLYAWAERVKGTLKKGINYDTARS